MAARSPGGEKRGTCRLSTALYYAFSEWLLIILLLVDSLCLFLVTKIFRSCKLQTPCLLCSRFGHFFGNEKLGFYRDYVCDAHKIEISNLAYCHAHKKLAYAKEMCETCLLSFSRRKPSLETFKLLLNKLTLDVDDGEDIFGATSDDMLKVPLLKKDHEVGSLNTCPCCSQPCTNGYSKLFQSKSIFKELVCQVIPLRRTRLRAWPQFSNGLTKARNINTRPSLGFQPGEGFDHLSHLGYRELKVTSESESEIPFSKDEGGSIKARGIEIIKEKSTDPPKSISVVSDAVVMDKLVHPGNVNSEASSSVFKTPFDISGYCEKEFAESYDSPNNRLEESNWNHVELKPSSSASSQITGEPILTKISSTKECLNVVGTSRASSASSTEVTKNSNLTGLSPRAGHVMMEAQLNFASGSKEAQLPNSFPETDLAKESAKLHEDLRQRLSQLPSIRWLESRWADLNHSAGQDCEYKLFDTPRSNALPNAAKKVEDELSCLESADESLPSEVEGETSIDRLKKQIEIDRKSLSALHKELEEERNASAIAANQAMAMISKLQEERAAMQMEALQYLRMMEEQTEYDQEALQKLNDQLSQREKQIQDLETELEFYKKRFADESVVESCLQPSYDSDGSEYSTTSTPHVFKHRGTDSHHLKSVNFQDSSAWGAPRPIKENMFYLEDEREYISECLKSLQRNVGLFSHAGTCKQDEDDDEFDDEITLEDTKSENDELEVSPKGQSRQSVQFESTIGEQSIRQETNIQEAESTKHQIPHLDILHMVANSVSPTKGSDPPFEEGKKDDWQNSFILMNKLPKAGKRNEISLGNVVEHLNARLEALESDRDFLEHTINSLRSGKEGIQFVREIATHLRELRQISLSQREHIFD
ncbi:hypothetical protein HPP92_026069 [Vanilla planifolia]|uniref:GTD-binding domain-containing protein n=1 Tax=Vanilla planifolia TaxID=51239 RepID=A0A835UA49_VANPL|nr:hypothetical protein HPP92_026341 [Vanilla planifolia]KAG0451811.1 hypothetical protein HPP92_026069 [Vanilla planifolia]